ncbi:MAG: glycosyltransferase family 4 protein, partial [Candidatus Eremiobacteraeota bacterium]|nr:glycosyltransferase family 4 protein [Candidatus Eremiobacteraeota bacterium]
LHYLPLDPARVDVIHHGVKELFTLARGAGPSPDAYVLFVGEPELRKGVATLMEAMSLLPSAMREATELVIAGATGQYPLPPTPDSVRLRNVGWVDDETLASLYAGARAFIYPSQYEGFGLPMIEAMACGTPVIASDAPGLREAGGPAALYVPPGDAQALAKAIEAVLDDAALAAGLRERGFRRAKELSWDETAHKTLAVIERAVTEGSAAGTGPA